MSTNQTPGRRQLDGPVRRVRIPTVAPASTPTPSAVGLIREPGEREEPIYVYRKPKRFRIHWGRKLLFIPLVLLLVVGGWFGFATLSALHKVIKHAGTGAPALAAKTIDLSQLKGEGDGRVNILIMGIGGSGHDGPNLSDTMMVWSIDPKTKDVAMLSIPRDLYVKIPATAKTKAQYGKINSANSIGGPALAEQVVENVIGVPIHYYAVVDFSGFKQAVDAVGGVDIDAEALNDPTFPCDNDRGYCPLRIAAGMQHMTGTVALRYARSRHTTSDFDRAARQQQVMLAVRQKAMDASTLTNPVKITNLIGAVGNHVSTDLQLGDLEKLALIAKDVDPSKVTQKVLDTGKTDSLLIDGSGTIDGAGSIELPKAGNFNYSDIQDFVKNIFADHYITDENARIEIQNGSGIEGEAGRIVTSLQAAHYNVGAPTNATGAYAQTVIYDYTNGKKPYTINYLEHRFGVTAQKATAPQSADGSAPPDIRIIIGSDYQLPGTGLGSQTN